MSKAIKSYPKGERKVVIARRLREKQGGLGYLSAVEAAKAEAVKPPEPASEEETPE